MTHPINTELASAANPFASFMDPAACIEAHERLASLPQQTHRPLDKPRIPKDADMAAADVMFGDVVAGLGEVEILHF